MIVFSTVQLELFFNILRNFFGRYGTNERFPKNFLKLFKSFNNLKNFSGAKKTDKTNFRDVEKNLSTDDHLNCIEKTTKKILTFMVNRYVFLHKMDNLFIDLKHKSIFYKINQRREPILRKMNGTVKRYSLDDECYERLVAILKRKDKTNEDSGENAIAAIESDVKGLVQQMEEMRKILDAITDKLN